MNSKKLPFLVLAATALVVGIVGLTRPRQAQAPTPAPATASARQLTFGIYTSDLATDMYQRFAPLLERMSADVSASLGEPVEIELRIFGSYQGALDALVRGDVDFARFGPASYVLARRENAQLELLAIEEKDGETRFDGLIIARADSDLQGLEDLAGRRFAFGDENSTIGRFLAQERLVAAGVTADSLAGYEYLGRHDKVLRAVELGDFDAGAVKESTFVKMNEDGALIVLDRFENVTKPWVARSGLPSELSAGLRASLVGLDDAEILKSFKVTRFLAADDSAFDFVRAGMERAERFTGD